MEEFYSLTMIVSIGVFTLSTAISPGPNNIMLLSSGLTFGFRKTVPHILGIIIGFPFMVFLVGIGLGSIFEKFPIILSVLKVVGIIYLFSMAYKIANNRSSIEVQKKSRPFTFLQSASFQWVNPKAWIMGITAISVFVTSQEDSLTQVLIISLIYMISGVFSSSTWAVGGVVLNRFITNKKMVGKLNIVMAILIISSVIPIIFE